MILRIVFIAVVLLYASVFSEGKAFDRKRIELTNDLDPATELQVHCQSGDDDLGPHTLGKGESYSWRFRVNFLQSTQFFCNFQWKQNGVLLNYWFDIYKSSNIYTVKCTECLWKVRNTGVCRSIDGKVECYPWN